MEKEAKNPLAQQMNELYGVPLLIAGEWLLLYGEDRFSQVLDMTEKAVSSGNLKNPIGYMRKAFEEQWTEGVTVQEAKQKLKEKKQQKKEEALAKKKAEELEKKKAIAEEKAAQINRVKSYIELLDGTERKEVFSKFYDDSKNIWLGEFPIDREQDPLTVSNAMLHEWFFDFVTLNIMKS